MTGSTPAHGDPGVLGARPVGPAAVLVEVDDHRQARSLARWLRSRLLPATEVVPGACTVLVDGLVGAHDHGDLTSALAGWDGVSDETGGPDPVTVPVVYDGPDLARVAELWGVDEHEVVARHTAVEFESAFCGFAPGFSYLAGLPAAWAVPRLDSPRPRVPTGAVALADRWCGVYPSASPGGWLVLGRTELRMWDLGRPVPALLPPGTPVRFVAT